MRRACAHLSPGSIPSGFGEFNTGHGNVSHIRERNGGVIRFDPRPCANRKSAIARNKLRRKYNRPCALRRRRTCARARARAEERIMPRCSLSASLIPPPPLPRGGMPREMSIIGPKIRPAYPRRVHLSPRKRPLHANATNDGDRSATPKIDTRDKSPRRTNEGVARPRVVQALGLHHSPPRKFHAPEQEFR